MVISAEGKVGFFDVKTTDEESFQYSLIKRHQLEFLSSVGERCPAGYIVYFRGRSKRVVFYSWRKLRDLQPQTSLKPSEGMDLGCLFLFSIRKIFLAHHALK